MKPLHSGFAGWFNRGHGRLGAVFADRHRTVTFTGESVQTLLAYVHNNPVRAGLVADPPGSSWTSHAAYAGVVRTPRWFDVERGLLLAGFRATPADRCAFHAFVVERCAKPRCAAMSGGGMQRHRALARAEAQAPVEVGTPTVSERGGRGTVIVLTIVPPECRPLRVATVSTTHVIQSVARTLDIPEATERSRKRSAVHGRRVAPLIWVRYLDRPAVQMARALGIAASTASELLAGAPARTQRLAHTITREVIVPASSEGM